jgi:hypothetical protein
MGYSNVAGDLNVYGTSTLSSLVVNGSTLHYGSLISTNTGAFSNIVVSNLTVTGNFTVNSTNTQVSNAISIVNQGSATALYVNQDESMAHTHNSLEVWDHTTLAMVVDPNGNVAIHQARSDGYSLSVVGGVSMDVLTLGTPLAISSGGTGTATGAPTNQVFAGPSIGSAGAPSFRALVNADLPSVISVSNVSANGSGLYSLNSSNLVGNIANANVALVVSQAAQPNITSVGLLTNLAVSNSLTTSNVFLSGNLNVQQTANIYVANIANIYTTNIVGFVGSQWTTGTGNIFYLSNVGIGTGVVSANLSVAGNIYASNALSTTNLFANTLTLANATSTINVIGNVIATTLYGALSGSNTGAFSNLSASNGVAIVSLNASNVVYGTLSTTVFPASGVTAGVYGSGANVSQVTVDTYGRVTAASNISITSSQWTTGTGNIFYLSNVGIGTGAVSANLSVTGNIYASNALSTTNLFLTGNLNVQQTANIYVANIANIYTTNIVGFVGSQWTTGTGNIYYLSNVGIGTSIVSANLSVTGNIYASNALQTTNVLATNANILSIQTSNLIPATQGLFMNLHSNFTLTSNWYGNIAGTITSNLYTLFNGTGGQTWDAYGQTAGPIVRGPTVNGGFTFAQPGPYSMTCSIASGSGVKTLAISSNAVDIHSNITNVWSYCFRYSFGEIPSIPITLPFYVSSTSSYYYLDIETNVQGDTVYQTAYSNAAANAYTGSYVIIRPI